MIRDAIRAALVDAMKAKDAPRVQALRLIQAAIKNRDIEERTASAPADPGSSGASDDALVIDVLGRMAKQRRESIALYEQGGRSELAAAEAAELAVIESFLPRQMDDSQAAAAIAALVAEAGATSLKEMGAVMALVKARLAGQIDMARASALVKAALAASQPEA